MRTAHAYTTVFHEAGGSVEFYESRATLVAYVENGNIFYQVAYVDPQDQFVRKVGVRIANEKLSANPHTAKAYHTDDDFWATVFADAQKHLRFNWIMVSFSFEKNRGEPPGIEETIDTTGW